MSEPRLTLIWPDGSVTTAENWGDLERAIRAHEWRLYSTRMAFRRALVRRVRVWSGKKVGRRGPSKRFIQALADAEMFMLIDMRAQTPQEDK